jgi:hypothetical protein
VSLRVVDDLRVLDDPLLERTLVSDVGNTLLVRRRVENLGVATLERRISLPLERVLVAGSPGGATGEVGLDVVDGGSGTGKEGRVDEFGGEEKSLAGVALEVLKTANVLGASAGEVSLRKGEGKRQEREGRRGRRRRKISLTASLGSRGWEEGKKHKGKMKRTTARPMSAVPSSRVSSALPRRWSAILLAGAAEGREGEAISGTEARRAKAGKAAVRGAAMRRAEPTERVTEVRMLSECGG